MVSVIIPTYNAGQGFIKLLNNLQEQAVKPSEIIVVDSDSRDETVKLAKSQNCKVISINCANFDHGTTRNIAISNINTEFAVFLTQDVVPADEYMVEELIKPMQADQNIAICYGRQLARPNARPLESFAREFNYPAESILKTKNDVEALGLKTFFCSNSCSAVRCSIFNKLGGFKNNVIVNEDMLFASKAILEDYSVYYAADARVYHSHPYSLAQTFRRYFNIGRFFADNKGIFERTGIKKYGGEMLKTGIKEFRRKRMPKYVAALLIEFGVKAVACKLGWYYQLFFK